MTVYSEEALPIPVGLGIDSYNHPANLADGFCTDVQNFLAKGDRLITRKGFQPPNGIDTRGAYTGIGRDCFYSRLPHSADDDIPVGIWAVGSSTWAIRQFNRTSPGASSSDAGIVEFGSLNYFRGAVTYLDRFYVLTEDGVERLSNWNWGAGTVTKTLITNTLDENMRGLFVFKDRLWSWDDTKIYYTDAPASPGAYPETWDVNANFIVIGAGSGLGKIHSVVPIGTKLFVFTASGLHNISVLGSPENWVVRLVDATVQVNHHNCAYEHKGLIYFIDSQGVWVTNQDETKLISEKIQDLFDPAPTDTYYEWKLVPFDEGILICRAEIRITGTPPAGTDRIVSRARIFYSRLEFIAWTEFTFDNAVQQACDLIAGYANMETHVTWSKTSYIVLAHGTSLPPGSFGTVSYQLLAHTGYQDIFQGLAIGSPETSVVVGSITSKLIRGSMLKNKRAKEGRINYSTDNNTTQALSMTYGYDTEQEDNRVTGSITANTVAPREGLIRIPGPEYFRHLLFRVTCTLTSTITRYTILGMALILHTGRNEPRNES